MKKILNADEVRKAIHFENPKRPPLCTMLWHNDETLAYYDGKFEGLLNEYPDDILAVHIGVHYHQSDKADDSNYRWAYKGWQMPPNTAIDNCPLISDWKTELDKFIDDMPDPNRADVFDEVIAASKAEPDRYILANWGHYFYQRLCYIRGTENLLYDFYDNLDELKRLMDALLEFYRVWAKRTAESGGHGVWAGDDLGTQSSLFMAPEKFRQIYKPYYKAFADILHENGLDFWLHTCGNVYDILEDIVECGVDVIHPIQAGCMDAAKTVKEFGGRIAFWAGMDVQQIIPFGTPDNIKKEIEKHSEIFYNAKGGIIYGAGNAIMAGAPIENIEAYANTLSEFCLNKRGNT